MVSWRAHLFAQKAEGNISDLSWRELWFMAQVPGGFGLEDFVENGLSLDGAVTNHFTTTQDVEKGAQIFGERCSLCHGNDGVGEHAPALNHSGLAHGDSELAIYTTIRDGIPRTGMMPVPLSIKERWQVIGYIRTLQLSASKQHLEQVPPLKLDVSAEQIRTAGTRTDEWLTYSGSIDGHRYTPLADITPANVSRVRLRWVRQFETAELGRRESTPIVVDGVIFTVESPSDVVAVDAKTGDLRWWYKRNLADKLPTCCSRTNRGLAVLGNTLYMGTLDGMLIALNASDGSVRWETRVGATADGFTLTGAPLIVNNSVVVGVAGGEYGIRGFLAAYDSQTGRELWKFITIPGPGEIGHDSWKNDAWKTGGGPTWVTGSYDRSLDLIYWGVGNPSPDFQGDVRPGDNLFTDSLIAVHGSTGKLAWYFQFTPHDEHDWDSAQTPILADMVIQGSLRKVVCAANRNGFYYVLDRTTGEFLSGVPFVEQNWAKYLDSKGRPVLTSASAVSAAGRLTKPGSAGGVNWENSALDPKKAFFFVPASEGTSSFTKTATPRRAELGIYAGSAGHDVEQPHFVVRALDAATGAKRWEHFLPDLQSPLAYSHSGLLATGGGLVLGEAGGYAFAMDSSTGREVWRVFLGGETYAAPISFTVDGHQVILVSAGKGLFMFGL